MSELNSNFTNLSMETFLLLKKPKYIQTFFFQNSMLKVKWYDDILYFKVIYANISHGTYKLTS
jgi:hypothetical protein